MTRLWSRALWILIPALLLLGWRTWTAERRAETLEREMQDLTLTQAQLAASAIFDANWALQQVDDPAASESEALMRDAIQNLIIARERLGSLRGPLRDEQLATLGERVHVLAVNLGARSPEGAFTHFAGYRRYLALLTEHLPFADRTPTLAKFRAGILAAERQTAAENFTVGSLPPVPPAMQLLIQGAYAPVRRGGACWQEAGLTRCTDVAGPVDLLKEIDAPVEKPGAPGELRFARAPLPGSVSMWRLPEPEKQESVSLTPDHKFTLPQEPGEHLFFVDARWAQGNGTYAFKVVVQ